MKRLFPAVGLTLCFVFLAAMLMPVFAFLPKQSETVVCMWRDGGREELSFAEAGKLLTEVGEYALLQRDGIEGEVALGSEALAALNTMRHGTLPGLLSLDMDGLSLFERMAVSFYAADKMWYDGDYYIWSGSSVVRTAVKRIGELILIGGELPERALSETKAEILCIVGGSVTAKCFVASSVKEIVAYPPYETEGGGLYLSTPVGRRFVAALPGTVELTVEECSFYDDGCFAPCTDLVSLSIPFAGTMSATSSSSYREDMGILFDDSVPNSLDRLAVRSGEITRLNLYCFRMVSHLDFCGTEGIDASILLDFTCLKSVKAPNALPASLGYVRQEKSACGCPVYEWE